MNAWSGAVIPVNYLHGRTPLERQGANVLQEKQCRNCHSIGGLGGQRGPALDDVATRLTEDQMIRQVLLGGGNMPAYGSALSPAETTALVSFLKTLRPSYQPAAADASRQVVERDSAPNSSTGERGGGDKTPIASLASADNFRCCFASSSPSRFPVRQWPSGILSAWSFPRVPFISLSLTGLLYLRGWRLASRTRPRELSTCAALLSLLVWHFFGSPSHRQSKPSMTFCLRRT